MRVGFLLLCCSQLSIAQHWQSANGTSGFPIAAISIYQKNPDTMYALGAGYQLGPGLLRSVDRGISWDSVGDLGSNIGALKVDPFDSKRLYASVYGYDLASNNVVASKDGGATWNVLFVGHNAPAPVVEIDPLDNRTVYVGVGPANIMRSTDRGGTWDTLAHPPASALSSLSIAPSNDSIIYVGYSTGIYKSTDRGNTWQALNLGFVIHSQTLLAVDPRSAGIVYAAVFPSPSSPSYAGGVYKSIDGGQTWQEAGNGLSDQDKQVVSIEVNAKNPNQVFIGLYRYDSQGSLFFQSTNGGGQWTDYGLGLPDLGAVNCIEIDTAGNRVYAGVAGYLRGLYSTDITTGVKATPGLVPKELQLFQNYPNPFNPTTVIEYQLQTSGFTKLTVYDIVGKEVKTLVAGYEHAGAHSVIFNAHNLASGVYICELRVDGQSLRRKMAVVR